MNKHQNDSKLLENSTDVSILFDLKPFKKGAFVSEKIIQKSLFNELIEDELVVNVYS